MQLDVELERCLCIHSLSQVIDITLQVLLYQRQIIPQPVQHFLEDTGRNAQSFKIAYENVKNIIRSTFRAENSLAIKEVAIIIGSTPYLPKLLYRIPVVLCRQHFSTSQLDGCGDNCKALTNREKRQIFSSMALSKTANNLINECVPTATDKVFFHQYYGQQPTLFEELEESKKMPASNYLILRMHAIGKFVS
uniref:Uncharacterized protein n=1 Tax=Ditylenchus dipsaci TaxID=166011 RepID=A0A915EPD5_9BILA